MTVPPTLAPADGSLTVASWNINSIRARLDRLLGWLETRQPDVLCLQELKCTDDMFPSAEIEALGYTAAVYGQRTYNGVAVLSRHPLGDIQRGLDDGVDDPQARLVSARVADMTVISVYVPNGQEVGSPAFEYKLEWFSRLRRYVERHHTQSDRVLVCGDFNVAPDPRDVHDARLWEGRTMFTEAEREGLSSLCQVGLADTLRQHHEEAGLYSWWDYRQLSFPKNTGLRIDHILVTPPLAERCIDAGIDREARKGKLPSDHAPIWARFADSP